MTIKKQTVFGELEIFDSHVHFFSHNFFAMLAHQSPDLKDDSDAVAKICEIAGITEPPKNPHELAGNWVGELDKNHVAKALLMARLPNAEESVDAAVAAHPDKFCGGFFFDPLQPDPAGRAERAFDEMRFKLVCLFPAMHGFSVGDDENVRGQVEVVRRRKGTAVFVHCGALSIGIRQKLGLPSTFDLRLSNPLEVHKLATEFPYVNFIIPHFGAGFWRETLMAADLCDNIYIEIDPAGTFPLLLSCFLLRI